MSLKYIDIHSHLNCPDFDLDLDQVVEEMAKNEIGTFVVGTSKESSKRAVEIAEKYKNSTKNIWAIIGCHPNHADEGFDYDFYKELAKNPLVVGIGETGLDYFYGKTEEMQKVQTEVFLKQISLANEVKKPLMLHIRDNKPSLKAYEDVIAILKREAKIHGNAHFFAGDEKIAKEFFELGYTISFTGVITFAKEYENLIKNLSLEKIMIETDSPYVAPEPYRSKRNDPNKVTFVLDAIARIKGLNREVVREQIMKNTKENFIFSL